MRRGELGVEQAKSAGVEPRDQMNQRHLAGIALAREHRLAEKGPTEPDAIEPADQTPMSPGFDRVAAAEPVELRVQRADAAIDPGVRPPERLGGAAVDDLAEFRVDPDLVGGAADRLAQAATDMELIEGKHPAHLRLHPIEGAVLGALGHREDAGGIGAQQRLRCDRRHRSQA